MNEAMAKPTFQGTRNKEVVRGVGFHSRSSVYHKCGLWAIKAKNSGSFPSDQKQASETLVSKRPPKFYPADDVPKPLRNKRVLKPTKLRSSITPGTVLNLLAGHFKGKRVVFLMQLESGLLLVTSPFKLNGVPLRRVSQSYVIATSTKLDVSKVDMGKITDNYFKKEVQKKKKKSESEFFEAEKEEKESESQCEGSEEEDGGCKQKIDPWMERQSFNAGYGALFIIIVIHTITISI